MGAPMRFRARAVTGLDEGNELFLRFQSSVGASYRCRGYIISPSRHLRLKPGDDAIRVLSADGLEVIIDLTVLYKVVPSSAPDILRQTCIDYTDKIVRPLTRTKIRDNAVYYDAVSLFSTKRDEFQARITRSIEEDFRRRGLLLEQILIRNITLPQSVKTSIEQKITAEQDAQKMQFVLQKEKQEAERKRVEAQGIADYQRIISESSLAADAEGEGRGPQKQYLFHAFPSDLVEKWNRPTERFRWSVRIVNLAGKIRGRNGNLASM